MELKKLFKTIYEVSQKENVAVYVVGGFVRDLVMGREFKKDIDFVVVGSGLAFAHALDEYLRAGFEDSKDLDASLVEFPDFDTARYVFTKQVDEEGLAFAEATAQHGKKEKLLEIEFAGARTEIYDENSRKPVVTATGLEEDLKRRDFTVNAMAQKVIESGLDEKIIDPFGGQSDIEKKILRTPLDPDITFSEDPLRMLRVARFAAQLEFTIEKSTYDALERNKERLKIISAERIQEEFFKLLSADTPSIGLWILYKTGLMDMFLPEVSALAGVEDMYGKSHKDNLSHTFKVVDNLSERTDNTLLRFAGLMHDVGKPDTKEFDKKRGWTFDMHDHLGKKMVRDIGKRLRMSRDAVKYVAHLVRWHMQPIGLMDDGVTDSAVRRLIINLQEDLDDLLNLCRSDITTGNPNKLKRRLKNYDYLEKRIAEVREKDKLRAFQSPVRGEEIMELCGLKPGPTVGKIKKRIEDAILDSEIKNEYDEARAYFDKIKDEYLKKAADWEKFNG